MLFIIGVITAPKQIAVRISMRDLVLIVSTAIFFIRGCFVPGFRYVLIELDGVLFL